MAREGHPKAISALLSRSIGNAVRVEAIFQENILLIRTASEEPLDQAETTEKLRKVLVRLSCPKVSVSKVETYSLNDQVLFWSNEFIVSEPSIQDEIPMDSIPDLAADNLPNTLSNGEPEASSQALQNKRWSFS